MRIILVPVILSFSLTTISAVVARGFLEFYVDVRQERMINSKPAVVPLTRRQSPRLKSRRRRDLQTGDSNITATDLGSEFVAPVTIGTQNFQLIIDTGSSDTWVPAANVNCTDQDRKPVNQSDCAFGPLFQDVEALTPIGGIIMNQSYDDGEFMTGPMYLEQVTLGGVTINQTQVSVVTSAFWEGDGVNSGLIGLSFPNSYVANPLLHPHGFS